MKNMIPNRVLILMSVVILGLAGFPTQARADIELGTTIIDKDTVWDYSGGYVLKGDVLIRSGVKLTITSGVQIDATKGQFTVRGSLLILGSSQHPVTIQVGKTLVSENSQAEDLKINYVNISGIRNEATTIGSGTTLIYSPTNLEIQNSTFKDIDVLVSCAPHPQKYNVFSNKFFQVKELFANNSGEYLQISSNFFYELQYIQNEGELSATNSNSYLVFVVNYLVNENVDFFAQLPPYTRYDFSDGSWTTSPMMKGNYFKNTERTRFSPATKAGYKIDPSVQPLSTIKSYEPQAGVMPLFLEFQSLIENYKNEVISDKAAADKAAADKAAADKAAAAKAAKAKQITITCIKGKLSKKVAALKPTCPTGYTKK